MDGGTPPIPLTELQRRIFTLIGSQRTLDSHVAGGTALHFTPELTRTAMTSTSSTMLKSGSPQIDCVRRRLLGST